MTKGSSNIKMQINPAVPANPAVPVPDNTASSPVNVLNAATSQAPDISPKIAKNLFADSTVPCFFR